MGHPKKGHSFSPELHTTAMQATRACITENTEKSCKDRNIYIPSDRQAVMKTLRYLRTASKLDWDFH